MGVTIDPASGARVVAVPPEEDIVCLSFSAGTLQIIAVCQDLEGTSLWPLAVSHARRHIQSGEPLSICRADCLLRSIR